MESFVKEGRIRKLNGPGGRYFQNCVTNKQEKYPAVGMAFYSGLFTFKKNKTMKLTLCLVASIILSTNITAQLKKFETAVEYNDYIIDEQIKIGKEIQKFNDIFTESSDTNIIHKSRIAIMNQADSSVKLVKLMQPYKGDTVLNKAAISLFTFYAKMATNEYTRLLQIYHNTKLSNEEIKKQLGEIITTITEAEKVVDKNFSDAQTAFAAKHGIKMVENTFKIKN
jgi:hypothetical protein